jgi:hypothetical protein
MSPLKLFVAGLVLVVVGAALPFLMIVGVLESSLWLGFVAYISSISGLVLGVICAAGIFAIRSQKDDRDDWRGL